MKTLKRALLSFLIILCPQVFAADYYTASGDPVAGSALTSSVIRAEYAAIAAGFAKIAPYTGAGSRVLFINTGATAQTTDAELTYNGTTNLLTINTSTFGLNTSIAGTLGVTGVATLTAQPILSSLTASLPVFSDASKGLVSNAMTGTGNVVMSASPTLTGTIGAASMTLSGTLGVTGGKISLSGGGVTPPASNGLTQLGAGTTTGLELIGKGSTSDLTLLNSDGASIASTPTGTRVLLPAIKQSSAYVWTAWAPSDVAGTFTNAANTAASSYVDAAFYTHANASGTLTITFVNAGSYIVNVTGTGVSGAAYTLNEMSLTVGGTATAYKNAGTGLASGGVGNPNYSGGVSIGVVATAGQTITLLPKGRVLSGGATGDFSFNATAVVQYTGG